jgi:signal peptidase I
MSEVQSALATPGPSEQPQLAAVPGKESAHASHSLQSLATTLVIAIFVITFLVQAFQIPSESMEKTLLVGDYLLVDKTHYGHSRFWNWLMPYRPIRRQDIIVFRYPLNPQQHFVKRVLGVPGDRVRLINKHVYVNGVLMDDSYATFNWAQRDRFRDSFPNPEFFADKMSPAWFQQARKLVEDGELIVPEGSYFALGDNRDDSYDSRYWGFVPAENIVGRPFVIYWSLNPNRSSLAGDLLSDKLSTLAYNVTHLFEILRWKRMLRIVH